jgi:hypothetical protein
MRAAICEKVVNDQLTLIIDFSDASNAIRFGQRSTLRKERETKMAKVAKKKGKPARKAKLKATAKRSGSARRKIAAKRPRVARKAKARRKAA